MVIRIDRMSDLSFGQLMAVYEEGNRENGELCYSHLSPGEQLLSAEQDFYEYLRIFFKTEGSAYYVLTDKGRYVSALRTEPFQDGFLLAALETMPLERGKGYALQLIYEFLHCMEKETDKVYSHVHKENLPSIFVHEKSGFVRIADYAVYIDGSVNPRAYTYCYFCQK